MIKVYIASPYTLGDVAANVKRQIDCADELMNLGFAPFAPLYSHFQHMTHPRTYDEWMAVDFEWVEACDCLLRLDGESKGADLEVKHATTFGKKVFYSIEDLVNHYNKNDMKLTIDTTAKTVEVLEEMSLGELVKTMKILIPGDEWETFEIKTKVDINWNPVVPLPDIQPYNPNQPFYYTTGPSNTGGISHAHTLTGNSTTNTVGRPQDGSTYTSNGQPGSHK